MLNLIDEGLLDLTPEEAAQICCAQGLSEKCSAEALRRSFGRVSSFLKAAAEYTS
jgi:hypothetical protein